MTDVINTGRSDQASDRSTAELVKQASEQISRLIRDELRLAQAELAEKGKRAGLGAGLFGTAGVVALYGVAGVLAAVVILLAYVMPAWLAGVLALVGRAQVRRATPPVPERAMASVKADIDTVSEAVRERGQHR
jgi:Flp pilus assembly protein TadB